MGEVHETRRAVDEREANRRERQDQPEIGTVDQGLEELVELAATRRAAPPISKIKVRVWSGLP